VRRWERVRDRFPDQAAGYSGLAQALREARQTDKAEAMIATALEKFPDDLTLRCEQATLATERGDWPAAERRWNWVLTHFPEQPAGYTVAAWPCANRTSSLRRRRCSAQRSPGSPET